MASPQTENGFVMIALDLFAAIMMADLPNRCMIVLSYHLIHSYGPGKKRDVFLDPATIEEHTRLHRNNVRRAVKELADAKILMRRTGGAYRFNKDYEAWMPGGKPFVDRLGGGSVEFTEWAKDAHGKPIKKSEKDPIQPDCPAEAESVDESTMNPIQRDSDINDEPNPTGLRTSVGHNPTGLSQTIVRPSSGIGSFANDNHMADSANGEIPKVSDDDLVRDRGRAPGDFRLEIKEGENTPPPPSGDGTLPFSDPIEDQPARRPTNFAPDLGTASALVSGPGKDSQEAIDLEAWAVQFGTDTNRESYAIWARSACNYVPATWVRALLRNKVEGRTDRKGLAYLNSVLGAWMNEGRCKYLTESKSSAPAKPAPPTEYHQAPANSRHRIKRDH